MLNDNHYTKNAYEDNGRFQIHPLSPEGLEAYLSKDSYNYHYLKSKYDPELIKQIQDEVNAQKEKQINDNQNMIEQEKKEEIKEQEKIVENKGVGKNKNLQGKNDQIKKSNKIIGNKQIKKEVNKKVINNPKASNTQKINNIGRSVNPVIINVKNDRGKLQDFQQPYHA